MPMLAESQTDIQLCRVDDIPLGLGRAFVVGRRSIAVFRTRKGEIRAIENACPHKGAPLNEGMIAGDSVVCPFHAFRFNLHNGECDQQEVCEVERFSTRVDDGVVWFTDSRD